jgi:TPR repeat protein
MAVHAQNELAARIEMEDAERAYSENRFDEALQALQKAETLLGRWTDRISHLKILTLDRLCDYGNPKSTQLAPLEAEVKKYFDYANKNADDVVMDKVREVYEINKKVEYAIELAKWKNEQAKWENMPEYLEGEKAYEGKDFIAAMDWFTKAANKGNGFAMYEIGSMYYYGEGVTDDDTKAMEWFRKAADKGIADAMYEIGYMYHFGFGVTEDETKAMEWLRKAADKGNVDAMNQIGFMYKNGYGVAKDESKAEEWYKKAKDAAK